MNRQDKNFLQRLLIPEYDEISLFFMSLTVILLYLTDDLFKKAVKSITDMKGIDLPHRLMVWVIYFIILCGLLLPLYHVFSSKPKSRFSKFCMLLFAIAANSSSGIIGGIYMLKQAKNLLVIFPILNIVSAASLVILYKTEDIDEDCISDENASIWEIVFSCCIFFCVFMFCRYQFKFHWAIIFSVCVYLVSNLNGFFRSLAFRRAHAPRCYLMPLGA